MTTITWASCSQHEVHLGLESEPELTAVNHMEAIAPRSRCSETILEQLQKRIYIETHICVCASAREKKHGSHRSENNRNKKHAVHVKFARGSQIISLLDSHSERHTHILSNIVHIRSECDSVWSTRASTLIACLPFGLSTLSTESGSNGVAGERSSSGPSP